MDIIIYSLSCIFPMLVYLFIGYGTKEILDLQTDSFHDFNKIIFGVFLPINGFFNVYNLNLEGFEFVLSIKISILGMLCLFVVSFLFYRFRSQMPQSIKPVLTQTSFGSNFFLLGIPLLERMMGKALSANTMIGLVLIIPIMNILSSMSFSLFGDERISLKTLVLDLATNPIILLPLIAFIFQLFEIQLPNILVEVIATLSTLTFPIALISIGGIFEFKVEKAIRKYIFEGLIIKLILVPAIMLFFAFILGAKADDIAVIIAVFATPSSVAGYSLASHLGGNAKVAEKILVYSSLFSTVTLFVFISILRSLGYM